MSSGAGNPLPNPGITSANLPKTPSSQVGVSSSTAQQVDLGEMDDTLIARPLTNPDFENVKPTNPNIRLRWINRDGPEGKALRFGQAQTQGFVCAVVGDIQNPDNFKHYLKDGHYINGDLILMKMDRRTYDGALKYNRDLALRLGSKAGMRAASQQEAEKTIGSAAAAKISIFTPSEKEINTLTGADKDKKLT